MFKRKNCCLYLFTFFVYIVYILFAFFHPSFCAPVQFIPWFIEQYFFLSSLRVKILNLRGFEHSFLIHDRPWMNIWEQHMMHGTSVYKTHPVFNKNHHISLSLNAFPRQLSYSVLMDSFRCVLKSTYDIYQSITIFTIPFLPFYLVKIVRSFIWTKIIFFFIEDLLLLLLDSEDLICKFNKLYIIYHLYYLFAY